MADVETTVRKRSKLTGKDNYGTWRPAGHSSVHQGGSQFGNTQAINSQVLQGNFYGLAINPKALSRPDYTGHYSNSSLHPVGRGRGLVNEHYNVPHHVSVLYTGRSDILEGLRKVLLPTSSNLRSQKRAILYGMGGSGKTQVCLKFATDYGERFWGVFWINLSTSQTARQSFQQIPLEGELLPGLDDVQKAKYHLANCQKPWLLILDNADDPSVDLLDYIPAGNRGSVLITTRNENLRVHAPKTSFSTDKFDTKDSIDLLLKACNLDPQSGDVRASARLATDELGHLPLALVQAGSVICRCRYSIEEYMSIYAFKRDELLDSGILENTTDYKISVYASWDISVAAIRKLSIAPGNGAVEDALELLGVLSFFHFQSIHCRIFSLAWTLGHQFEAFWEPDFPLLRVFRTSPNIDGTWDDTRFREALAILRSFSLIQDDSGNTSLDKISIHKLVHSWMRDRLDTQMATSHRRIALAIIGFASKRDSNILNLGLIPHLKTCLSMLETQGPHLPLQQIQEIQFFDDFGLAGIILGSQIARVWSFHQPLAGKKRLEVLYSRLASHLGDHHEESLEVMQSLRHCHAALAEWQMAAEVDSHILAARELDLNYNTIKMLRALCHLAEDYIGLGENAEARLLLLEIEEFFYSGQLEHSHDAAGLHLQTYLTFAQLELNDGSIDGANWFVKYALSEAKASDKAERMQYPYEMLSKLQLADKLYKNNKNEMAFRFYQAAFANAAESLGIDHPLSQYLFGIAHANEGCKRCLSIGIYSKTVERSLPPPVQLRIDCPANSDLTRDMASQLAGFPSQLNSCIQRYGAFHPVTLQRAIEIAVHWIHSGNSSNGFDLLQKVREAGVVAFQKQWNVGALTLHSLAHFFAVIGSIRQIPSQRRVEFDEFAVKDAMQVAQFFLERRGPHDILFARMMFCLGQIFTHQQRWIEACQAFSRVLVALEDQPRYRNLLYTTHLLLFAVSEKVARQGDPQLQAVHSQASKELDQRELKRWTSKCQLLPFTFRTNNQVTQDFRLLPDDETLTAISEYWAYRLRCQDCGLTHNFRQRATRRPLTLGMCLAGREKYSICLGQERIIDDGVWSEDLKTLVYFHEVVVGSDEKITDKFESQSDHRIDNISRLTDCYVQQGELERARRLQNSLIKRLMEDQACPPAIDSARKRLQIIWHAQMQHQQQQAKNVGLLREVIFEFTQFAIESTLYIASGFEWDEEWRAYEECSSPLRTCYAWTRMKVQKKLQIPLKNQWLMYWMNKKKKKEKLD